MVIKAQVLCLIPLFVIVMTGFATPIYGQTTGCTINVADLPEPQPLVFAFNFDFYYPSTDNPPGDTSIAINYGERFTVSCVQTQFSHQDLSEMNTIVLTCKNSSFIADPNITVNFSDLQCKENVQASLDFTGSECGNQEDTELVNVIFDVRKDNQFVQKVNLSTVCWDKFYRRNLYSRYSITKAISYRKIPADFRPNLIEDLDMFKLNGTSLAVLYSKENSVAVVNQQVGLPSTSSDIISEAFGTGKLIDYDREFVYTSQVREAARYINIFPEWPRTQSSNWDTMNADIVSYVQRKKIDLEILTGTWGTYKLLDHTSATLYKDIFLNVDEEYRTEIPVPILAWKVLYDPASKKALALLVENPLEKYAKEQDFQNCNDISSAVSWLTWEGSSTVLGLAYACSYHDLREKLTYLPPLQITGNLVD